MLATRGLLWSPAKICWSTAGKCVVGVRIELALKLGKRLHEDLVALRVGVRLRPVHSVDLRVYRLQRSQHVVEGAVLHHEHDNVL